MDKNFEIEEFKTKLFERAKEKGFTQYELSYGSSNSFSVRIFNGEISEYKNSSTRIAKFKGIFEGVMGNSSSELIDETVIEFLINSAIENATIKDDEGEFLYEGDESYPEVPKISEELLIPDSQAKIGWAKEMEAYAKCLDSRIVSVDSCIVSNGYGNSILANSHGLSLSSQLGTANASITVRASSNGKVKTGNGFFIGRDFTNFDPKEIAREAVEKAISKLESTNARTADYEIIIENKMVINLFSAFISNFFAERVQKGLSLLNGKIGEKIGAEKLTIRDDYKHEKSIHANAFDSEGVATRNKIVIENGILKTFLYNLKSAKQDDVKPTGNGFSGATSTNLFYIEPSETKLEGMMKKMENGILITHLAGLHSGTNAISGDFSLQADGFTIENGKKTKPIENFVLSGNF
ncbi:MAG: TldD/PmbA family protein, partial [Defluviitaleaceae bacterium]|nr:TldD/PmbA family protein [Defluviitaleaceae bacterium]